jgi:hypothetical protein
VSEEAALAHAQLLGKAADGEALEALERGDVYGAAQDGFAGAETASLRTGRRLAESAWGGRHEGKCNTEE